jgi:hypothetical protein
MEKEFDVALELWLLSPNIKKEVWDVLDFFLFS